MNKNTQSEQIRATKLAMLRASDSEDLAQCVSDMKKFAGLGDDDAEEVALSIRDKNMPSVLEELGLGTEDFGGLGKKTVDFAEKTTGDDDKDFDIIEEESCDSCGKLNDAQPEEKFNDDSEVDDDEIATIQISVPANKVHLIEQTLRDVLGGEEMDADSMSESEDSDDSMIHSEEEDERSAKTMDTKQIEARKAARREVIAEIEEVKPRDIGLGNDTSANGKPFQFSDKNQKKDELKLTTKQFTSGSETEFSKEFPDYSASKVPTTNPEYLQLKNEIDALKLEGTPENAADYEVKFDVLNNGGSPIPSNDEAGLEVAPLYSKHEESYNPNAGITTKAASVLKDVNADTLEELVAGVLVEAGVEQEDLVKMTFAEGVELAHAIRLAKKEEAEVVIDVQAKEKNSSMVKTDDEDEDEKTRKAQLEKARIKAAFSCANKLILSGIVPQEDLDDYAESMLSDGLSVSAMLRQTTLMLRSAEGKAKVAATNSGLNKTASAGVTFNPSFGSPSNLQGALDIREALSGAFTVTKYGDVRD